MRRVGPLLITLLVIAAACSDGNASAPGPETPSPSTTTSALGPPPGDETGPEIGPSDVPPDLVLVSDTGQRLALSAISYCWSGPETAVCADGMPVEPYPVLSGKRSFVLQWPIGGWVWTVVSASGGDSCSPSHQLLGVRSGGLVTVPVGPQVSIFGRGPGGDAWFVLAPEFSDPIDSLPLQASLGWAPPGDHLPEHSHLWLTIANLGEPPDVVEVGAVVTSGPDSVEIPLTAEWVSECWTGGIGAYADPGSQSADLSGLQPPYEVVVTITIDDRRFVAAPVTWPDDYPIGSDEGPLLTLAEE
jgi:hypothetical protein